MTNKGPEIKEWMLYVGLAVATLSGLAGGGTSIYQATQPSKLSADVQVLVQTVQRHEEELAAIRAAFQGHSTADAALAEAVRSNTKSVGELETRQSAIKAALDEIRVNQLVICRTLEAPCSR